MSATYPEGYFALQVAFARHMVALTHTSLQDALLTQTSLYKLLGAPGDFDASQPIWRELLALVDARADADEQSRAIYDYYRSRLPAIRRFDEERHWGCFAYDWRPQRRAIRIHFSNEDAPEPGALSHQRRPIRLAELRAMFVAAREERPEAQQVIGASWLYNMEAYRRLFPPAFGASATPTEPEFQYRALWGQFLRSDWSLNEERADTFLGRVVRLDDPAQAVGCFRFQVLQTHAPISAFFAYYGL